MTNWHELTGFQRDLLKTALRLAHENRHVSGQDITREIERNREAKINHGRLYPNLDSLVEAGLLSKGSADQRTNDYQPSVRYCGSATRCIRSTPSASRGVVEMTEAVPDNDRAEEMSVYVDQELLTRAKGAVMLDEGREVTDDAVIGKALQALVDGPVAGGNSGVAPVERCGSCEAQEMIANAN